MLLYLFQITKSKKFDSFEDGLGFLEIVKENVQPEEWKYVEYQDYSVNYPILKSYLEHTFKRLKQEGKLVESIDGKLILFNTGLLEKNFLLDVYICCEKKKVDIFDIEYCLYTEPKLIFEEDPVVRRKFGNKKPETAKYFTTIDEVIFNPELEIDLNWSHIFIERRDRIPSTICLSILELIFRENRISHWYLTWMKITGKSTIKVQQY